MEGKNQEGTSQPVVRPGMTAGESSDMDWNGQREMDQQTQEEPEEVHSQEKAGGIRGWISRLGRK